MSNTETRYCMIFFSSKGLMELNQKGIKLIQYNVYQKIRKQII